MDIKFVIIFISIIGGVELFLLCRLRKFPLLEKTTYLIHGGITLVLFLTTIVAAYTVQEQIKRNDEDGESLPEPNIIPIRSIEELYPAFNLSGVDESVMLDLIDILGLV